MPCAACVPGLGELSCCVLCCLVGFACLPCLAGRSHLRGARRRSALRAPTGSDHWARGGEGASALNPSCRTAHGNDQTPAIFLISIFLTCCGRNSTKTPSCDTPSQVLLSVASASVASSVLLGLRLPQLKKKTSKFGDLRQPQLGKNRKSDLRRERYRRKSQKQRPAAAATRKN